MKPHELDTSDWTPERAERTLGALIDHVESNGMLPPGMQAADAYITGIHRGILYAQRYPDSSAALRRNLERVIAALADMTPEAVEAAELDSLIAQFGEAP